MATVYRSASVVPGCPLLLCSSSSPWPDADCRLDVLDFRAEADLFAQLERCGAWAAENAPPCVSHAVQRWRAGGPDAGEIAAVAAWDGVLADWLGRSCAGSPVVTEHYERAAEALRSGESPCHRPDGAPRPMR